MRELLQLRVDRSDDLRVAVAGVHHRDTAGEVDEAPPFDIPQLRVVGALGEEARHHAHTARRGGGLAGHELFVR